MLIEFSIANFRSFRERQTLSMVAAPRMHKRENVLKISFLSLTDVVQKEQVMNNALEGKRRGVNIAGHILKELHTE